MLVTSYLAKKLMAVNWREKLFTDRVSLSNIFHHMIIIELFQLWMQYISVDNLVINKIFSINKNQLFAI